jgi:hypothetical protein
MLKRSLAVFCVLLLAAPHVGAQGLEIDHQPIGCLVADNFPELSACFKPASDVARARLQFRAAGTAPWYFVEMQAGGACYTAILPKPKSSTKAIEYYVDVASKGFGESRTPDYAPRVASGIGGCKRRGLIASFATTAAVRVFAPLGAPPIPVGFSSAGVTSTIAATGPSAASASGSGGGAEPETSAAKKGKAQKPVKAESGGGGSGAGVVLGILAVGAAGGAVYYTTQKKDPAESDDDGDGVSEKDGDCDDGNKDVSPNGGFSFNVDFAWTGSTACGASSTRAQTYRVQNKSCTPLTVSSLTLVRFGSGSSVCPPGPGGTETLALSANSVAPGATTTIRTGPPPSGTAPPICCIQDNAPRTGVGLCPTGNCTVSETYTLTTSAGTATATNSFVVTAPNGCPFCGSLPSWPLSETAPLSQWTPRVSE